MLTSNRTLIALLTATFTGCGGVVAGPEPEPLCHTPVVFYGDYDGDGYGNPGSELLACLRPPGWADNAQDCNDADALAHPGGDERCNLLDDDCDGDIDEEPVGQPTAFLDQDADGYGTGDPVPSCPGGPYADNDDDCDDASASVHPGALESCDGLDSDCDGKDAPYPVSAGFGVGFDSLGEALGSVSPQTPALQLCEGEHVLEGSHVLPFLNIRGAGSADDTRIVVRGGSLAIGGDLASSIERVRFEGGGPIVRYFGSSLSLTEVTFAGSTVTAELPVISSHRGGAHLTGQLSFEDSTGDGPLIGLPRGAVVSLDVDVVGGTPRSVVHADVMLRGELTVRLEEAHLSGPIVRPSGSSLVVNMQAGPSSTAAAWAHIEGSGVLTLSGESGAVPLVLGSMHPDRRLFVTEVSAAGTELHTPWVDLVADEPGGTLSLSSVTLVQLTTRAPTLMRLEGGVDLSMQDSVLQRVGADKAIIGLDGDWILEAQGTERLHLLAPLLVDLQTGETAVGDGGENLLCGGEVSTCGP